MSLVSEGMLVRGTTIAARYLVLGAIGSGGYASVYRCRDLQEERTDGIVAIKLMSSSGNALRFRREVEALWRVEHRHLIRCLDFGVWEGVPFIVMELANGGSLREYLNRYRRLSIAEAAWIIYQVASGLRASKIIHRDLKPENLLMSSPVTGMKVIPGDETATVIKVADFGLAAPRAQTEARLTQTADVMGTPLYMSPEQCRCTKKATVQSDIYSLGAILFEMVTGAPPFDGENALQIMMAHRDQSPVYPTDLPYELTRILVRCLDKKSEHRYPSLLSLQLDLQRLYQEAPLKTTEPHGQLARRKSRWGWSWLVRLLRQQSTL